MKPACNCNPDDDCTCDQTENTQLASNGYHLVDGQDTRGYWDTQTDQIDLMLWDNRLDYDTAMAQRALREYGYIR